MQWISSDHIIRQGPQLIKENMETQLSNRKICYSDKKDIIRWGYEARGAFTSQEAYNIIIRNHIVKDLYGTKYGLPPYGQKYPLSSGCYAKIKSSPGTTFGKEAFMGLLYVPIANRRKKPLSIS